MGCTELQAFLDGELTTDQRAEFEKHLGECRGCQDEVEAAVRFYVLGAELAERPDRPRPVLPGSKPAKRWMSPRFVAQGSMALAAAAALVLFVVPRRDARARLDDEIADRLSPRRATLDRLPVS